MINIKIINKSRDIIINMTTDKNSNSLIWNLIFMSYCLFIGFLSFVLWMYVIDISIIQMNVLCIVFLAMSLIGMMIRILDKNFLPKYHIVTSITLFIIVITYSVFK